MGARVSWFRKGTIVLFAVSNPLTLDDLERGAEEVWALAAEVREPVDMIFDYGDVSAFPRGGLPVVREGHFTLPTLDRVALVGCEPMVEMIMTHLTRETFRPDPTIHLSINEAAQVLEKLAEEDQNR